MPRLVSFQFTSSAEEDKFFALLADITQYTTEFEGMTRKGLLDKGIFQIMDVASYTTQIRAALVELETLVRD